MLILLAKNELNEGRKALFSSEHTLSLKALWCINFEWIHNFLEDTNCYFCFVIQMEDTSTFPCCRIPGVISLFYFPLIRPLRQQEGKSCRLAPMQTCQAKMGKGAFLSDLPLQQNWKMEGMGKKGIGNKDIKGIFIHHFYYSAHAIWQIKR